MENQPTVVKVSSKSAASKVAGAVTGLIREGHEIEVRFVGSTAGYISLQALALASRFLKEYSVRVAVEMLSIDSFKTDLEQVKEFRLSVFTLPLDSKEEPQD